MAVVFYGLTSTTLLAQATPETWKCPVELEFDYPLAYAPVLEKTCMDGNTMAERCYDFQIRASGHSHLAWTFESSQIGSTPEYPPEVNRSIVNFRPVNYSPLHVRSEDPQGSIEILWLIGLIDSSGSPSRAEERFMVLDGQFQPQSPLMTYDEYYGSFEKSLELALPVDWKNFKCALKK